MHTSEAVKGICGSLTACNLDDRIVNLLALWTVNWVGWDNRTGVHDCAPEKWLALVGVVAFVDDHVVEDRDGAGRLTPDGDLIRVTTESSNVVGNPLKTETLIEKTQVGGAILKNFLAWLQCMLVLCKIETDTLILTKKPKPPTR